MQSTKTKTTDIVKELSWMNVLLTNGQEFYGEVHSVDVVGVILGCPEGHIMFPWNNIVRGVLY